MSINNGSDINAFENLQTAQPQKFLLISLQNINYLINYSK